jgi:hypothetical protein
MFMMKARFERSFGGNFSMKQFRSDVRFTGYGYPRYFFVVRAFCASPEYRCDCFRLPLIASHLY